MTPADDWMSRVLAPDPRSTAELLAAYRQGPALVRDAVEGMSGEMLRARPVEGKMSTLEVVCHIADAEQYYADRMKRTVWMDVPLLVGVDGMRYLPGYHDRDIGLQLSLIEVTRYEMAANLERLPEDAWSRRAVHTELGMVDLRQEVVHAIRHVEGHLEAVAEKRRALGL